MTNKAGKISGIIIGIIYISAFAIIGAYAGNFAEEYLGEKENITKEMLIILLFVILAYAAAMIHIAAHEAGHLLFGRMTGYKFRSYRIFNLMWQREKDGKIKFYKYSLAGTGGQCIMEPPETEPEEIPFIMYNLGGITVNLGLSLIFGSIALAMDGAGFGRAFCVIMAIIGIAFSAANGIPLPSCTNDGSNIINIAKSKKARKAFWVQMKSVILLTDNVRIKDFPEKWFSMPDEKGLQNTMEAVMAIFVCDRLMDEHRFEEAEETIEKLLNQKTAINQIHRNLIETNVVFLKLLKLKSDEKIREEINRYKDKNLEQFWKAMKTNPSVIRTRYTYEMLYEKNKEKAEEYRRQFEKAAEVYPYPVEIETEREFMKMV